MSLKVDIEILKRKIAEAHILLLMLSNDYIESMRDPEDEHHVGLNLQIQEAAKGDKDVYLLCRRPIERDNFSLVMDMLEGSKLKTIVFFDPKNEKDLEMATRIIRFAMGPGVSVSGNSGDAVVA